MNIKEGPMIRKFATQIDTNVPEVLEWANNYVNQPNLFVETEDTAEKRAESIKKYITSRVENSLTERIKRDILAQKEETMSKRNDSDDFTCRSCEHSIGYPEPMTTTIWCQKHDRKAGTPCQDFTYEPGTDEWEIDQ